MYAGIVYPSLIPRSHGQYMHWVTGTLTFLFTFPIPLLSFWMLVYLLVIFVVIQFGDLACRIIKPVWDKIWFSFHEFPLASRSVMDDCFRYQVLQQRG